MVAYRLGLDMGTNSIGWCALRLKDDGNPIGFLDWGVRIFNDGREPAKAGLPGDSSAVQRRVARGMRRRYDRRVMRKRAVMRILKRYELMPDDRDAQKEIEKLNPLQLRNDGLKHKLTPYEIGRAFFHLQQRRGFKSNRKEQKSGDNKIDGMKLGIRDLFHKLEARKVTLGQFLYEQHKKRISTRFRPELEGNKAKYEFYPQREMVQEEFNRIWEVQAKYYPTLLTEEAREAVYKTIFFQRKLKPQPVGKCGLNSEDDRMAWAIPSAQRFRILKEINNLVVVSEGSRQSTRTLSLEEKKILYNALCLQGSLTFGKIKTLLKIDKGYGFNLDIPPRKGLDGDKTAQEMRKETRFGKIWDKLSLEDQDAIIGRLLGEEEDEAIEKELIERFAVTGDNAKNIIESTLPEGHARFGKTVISSILPKMHQGMLEHEAIKESGWHHSQSYTGEIFEELPYYGKLLEQHVIKNEKASDPMVREFGRVSNPTVHIALNQLRRLLNTLKKRYGRWPEEIVIEMARELKHGRKEIADVIRQIDKNTKQKEKWKKDIEDIKGASATADDFLKMKLWEELAKDPTHRRCVYTGKTISATMLFNGQVQLDHILPRSKTLDDTSANRIVVTVEGNQIKRNGTPYEAFSHQSGEYSYEKVWERAQTLPLSKRWRFREDAMEIFDSKAKKILLKSHIDGSSIHLDTGLESFAARQLNDTSYIAKLAKKYLGYACEKGPSRVSATPGMLTGLLRKAWGLNALLNDDNEKKNRNDHRHHAVDALIIALTTQSTVQKVAKAAAKAEAQKDERLVKYVEKPWVSFDVSALRKHLEDIVVSHKPDHGNPGNNTGGTSGKLHDDTYYGYVDEKEGKTTLVIRWKVSEISKPDELECIRDKALKQKVKNYVLAYTQKEKMEEITKEALQKALREFSKETGVRAIRMLEEKSSNVLVTVMRDRRPYKIMQGGSNHRAEIYSVDNTKGQKTWRMETISAFNANQKSFVPEWRTDYPDTAHIMSLHMGDMVAYEENEKLVIARVKKIELSREIIHFIPHTAVGDVKSWAASPNQMQLKKLRRILVEIDGSIYDPSGILTTSRNIQENAV